MTAISNLWRGMIQRRLWPVALVLLAALAAVPMLLARDPEPVPAPVVEKDTSGETALTTQPVVVPADPAARERGRKVAGERKDPFEPVVKPQAEQPASTNPGSLVTAPTSTPSSASGGSGGSGGARTYTSTSGNYQVDSTGGAPVPAPSSPAPEPVPAPAPTTTPAMRFYDFELTVRFGVAGEEREPEVLPLLTALPSSRNPVAVYLGLRDDHSTAVFLVGAGVTVEGDASCKPSPSRCTFVELRKGEQATLVSADPDGGAPVRYRLDHVDVEMKLAKTPEAARDARASTDAEREVLRGLVKQSVAYGAAR